MSGSLDAFSVRIDNSPTASCCYSQRLSSPERGISARMSDFLPLPLAGEVDALAERGGWGKLSSSLPRCDTPTPPSPQAGEGDEQRGVWSAKAVTHRVVAVDYAFANPPYEVFPEHPLVVIHRARRRSYASRRCPGDPRSWRTRGRTWMAGTSARVASPGHDGERMPRHAGAAYLCLFSALPPGR